jgi:hypothetical protein
VVGDEVEQHAEADLPCPDQQRVERGHVPKRWPDRRVV